VRSVKGQGGCILIDAEGRIATAMNSPQMVRGSLVEGESMRLGIGPQDDA
jgi:isoaspartyl peptidase/L-asparaginase-like protein (Ntn-hydrolase superfamily)